MRANLLLPILFTSLYSFAVLEDGYEESYWRRRYTSGSTEDDITYWPGNIWNNVFLREPPVQFVRDGDTVDLQVVFATHWVTGNWQGTRENYTFPIKSRRYDDVVPSREFRIARDTKFHVKVANNLWGTAGPGTADKTCVNTDGISYSCMNHTNLHLHGLVIDPEGDHGDNVMVDIPPGRSHNYTYIIPDDHPQGTFWYHPHWHGSTALQVASGVFGSIVIEDDADEYATDVDVQRFLMMPESTILLSYHYYQLYEYTHLLETNGISTYEVDLYNEQISVLFNYTGVPWVSLTNGQYRPGIEIIEKTYYRWRIVMAPVIFVNLTFFPLFDFGAHCTVQAIARDGIYFESPDYLKANAPQLFSSGNRLDVVVYCEEVPYTDQYLYNISGHTIYTEEDYLNAFFLPVFKKCPDGVCDSGRPWRGHLPIRPKYMRDAELFDYSALEPRRITLDFNYRPDPEEPHFPNYWWSVNKESYSRDHTLPAFMTGVPTSPVVLESFELWRLETWENLGHVFHLHTNHFMLTDYFIANSHDIELGRTWEPLLGRWMDNIMVPLGDDRCHTGTEDQTHDVAHDQSQVDNSTCNPGWVEILVHFTKFPGKRILHCHFLNHEDHGMMSWIEVCDPTGAPLHPQCPAEATATDDEDDDDSDDSDVKSWLLPLLIGVSALVGVLLLFFLLRPMCKRRSSAQQLEYATVQ